MSATDSLSVKLHSTTSGEIWAEEFAKVARDRKDQADLFDHDFLVGWFANAIQTGKYAGERADADKLRQAVKDEHDRAIAGVGYLSAIISDLAQDGDPEDSYAAWLPNTPSFLEIWQEGYLHAIVEDDDE